MKNYKNKLEICVALLGCCVYGSDETRSSNFVAKLHYQAFQVQPTLEFYKDISMAKQDAVQELYTHLTQQFIFRLYENRYEDVLTHQSIRQLKTYFARHCQTDDE